jgi:NAD(P)-dependent dehydrogenase (short-subunit alcohol dehydrogenase family)
MNLPDGARRFADAVLEATIVPSFSRIGYEARRRLGHWDAAERADLSDRHVLLTGATSGIGFAAAHALAVRGARLWIVGRDQMRVERAREAIAHAAPQARLEPVLADLAVLDDVRRLADTVGAASSQLDIVIHNAGTLARRLVLTVDGLEVTAQVHVIAPFLLTTLLLPALRRSPDARVITVSSGGMYMQPLDVGALDLPPRPFRGVRAYANAKRAQVVLNERWALTPAAAGVAFHAMHPGWAATPGIRSSLPRFASLMGPVLRTPAQGAGTIVWLAEVPSAEVPSGRFWHDRRARSTVRLPRTRPTPAEVEHLWRWCVARAGVGDALEGAR